MNEELRVIILAAGKGTRMNSDLPKVLHKLNGKPLIDHVLDESELLNPKEILLVVGFKKKHVISHTKNRINLEYAAQIQQLGTGHAVLQTEELLKNKKGHILILYGDVPNIKDNIQLDTSEEFLPESAILCPGFLRGQFCDCSGDCTHNEAWCSCDAAKAQTCCNTAR